jgi:hypothetical protein
MILKFKYNELLQPAYKNIAKILIDKMSKG